MLFKGSVHWTVPASSRKLSPVDYKLYKLEELGGGGYSDLDWSESYFQKQEKQTETYVLILNIGHSV